MGPASAEMTVVSKVNVMAGRWAAVRDLLMDATTEYHRVVGWADETGCCWVERMAMNTAFSRDGCWVALLGSSGDHMSADC